MSTASEDINIYIITQSDLTLHGKRMMQEDLVLPIVTRGKRFIVCLWLLLLSLSAISQTSIYGDFPYYQPFTSGIQPTEVDVPGGSGTNDAWFTPDGLRLTRASNNLFGAVFINNRRFNSDNGIKIAFEYAIYDGTGADGISVFLFDASVANPSAGSEGRQLGYAYNRANNQNAGERRQGLTGAYLGIGLDVFGNHKQVHFAADERINGVPAPPNGWAGSNGRSHVTLRGAEGAPLDTYGRGQGFTGYPVLVTQSTQNTTAVGRSGAILNETGGEYTYLSALSETFDLEGGFDSDADELTTDPNNPAYRKAFIDILPKPPGIGGLSITVNIQHGNTITTVIDNYHYRHFFDYAENANASGITRDFNDNNNIGSTSIHTLDASIPEFFRIGFAASTGGSTNIHLIRNLTVVLPYTAETEDDDGDVCLGGETVINVFDNDIAYSEHVSDPVSGSAYIDPDTFRFYDEHGEITEDPYNYANGFGQWIFDSASKRVKFIPNGIYEGEASVSYSVKGYSNIGAGEPYGDEAYRSLPATIRVKVRSCGIITNPMLPSKAKRSQN